MQHTATARGLALASIAFEALALGLRAVLVPAVAALLAAAGYGRGLVKARRRREAAAASQGTTTTPEAGSSFQGLTVRELRQLARAAGHRVLARSGRRADLLAALAGA